MKIEVTDFVKFRLLERVYQQKYRIKDRIVGTIS
jgi:hypothetical protein